MYAKICILHTPKRESFKVAKHFRTTYVPATERFHTWRYWGKNFFWRSSIFYTNSFPNFLTHTGEWCSVEENSFVEWSCLLGIPEAWQRSFSKGNLENRGILIIFSFRKWDLIFPPTQIDQLISISTRFSWKLSNNNLLFPGEVSRVELRLVLPQVRGGEGGPRDLQGSLHHADIQAAQQPEVDALLARWVQHSFQ